MIPQSMQDTAEFFARTLAAEDEAFHVASSRVDVQIGALSHQGKVRTNNEDHYLVARYGRSLETLLTNMPQDPIRGKQEENGFGMLVADGMGGMAAGEVASRTAIQALVNLVLHTPDWIFIRNEGQIEEVMRRMGERILQINEQIVRQSREDSDLAGMGTTMTFAASLGLDLILCHVGDSRAYLYRHGKLHQWTRDMTMAQALMEAGAITAAEVATNRFRNVLTQCLGREGKAEAQLQHVPLEDGDRFLLCSDGLTDMVDDPGIAEVMANVDDPQQACQALVDLALDHGGKDNVTVIIADYQVCS